MRLATLLGPDLRDTLSDDPEALKAALEEFHPEDVAELIADLPREDAIAVLGVLSAELGAEVVGRLPPELQVELLEQMPQKATVELLRQMPPDDRVDLVQELPEDEARTLLTELAKTEPEAAEEIRELGAFGPETAGGLMTPLFASLPPETKVWEAIEELRRLGREGEAETIYSVYVCGYGEKLLGVVSLRDLILSEPSAALADVMTEKVVRVSPGDDQERVADTIARYDLTAVPVIDEDGRMLGVVTVDDVVDVVIEEATEDAQKMGGVVPLEDSYFATGALEFVWKRGTWLVVLFFGQLLTANVIENNKASLAATLDLVIFIPLIIASGGNSGSQSSSLIIRALAVGEVAPRDWFRVAGRELGIGVAMGIALGAIGCGRALLFGTTVNTTQIAIAVGASIVAVVTMGSMIGSLLPLGIRRLGMDPAVSSTPFISSVIDVLGLIAYFALAHAVLAWMP